MLSIIISAFQKQHLTAKGFSSGQHMTQWAPRIILSFGISHLQIQVFNSTKCFCTSQIKKKKIKRAVQHLLLPLGCVSVHIDKSDW